MDKYEAYLRQVKLKLIKAIAHLEYSYKKVSHLSFSNDEMNDETLEIWEGFCARFSRVADIFLIKYIKTYVKINDPGFEGSFRDYLNQAEKLGLIQNTKDWLKIRELRNKAAHDYAENDLASFLHDMKLEAVKLIAIKESL